MRIDFIIALNQKISNLTKKRQKLSKSIHTIIIIHCVSNRSLIAPKYAAAEDIIVHYSTPLVSISDDTYIRYYILIAIVLLSLALVLHHQPFVLITSLHLCYYMIVH